MIVPVTWVPPCLCGCQFQITGDFDPASIVNGVSYKHPRPGSIQALQLVSVCSTIPAHAAVGKVMPATGKFFTDPNQPPANSLGAFLLTKYPVLAGALGAPVQTSGYLSYPIANPTAAHCLYTLLSQIGGQINRLPCGCQKHQWVDLTGVVTDIVHPVFTKKCPFHQNDDVHMTQAAADFAAYVATQPVPPPG